MPDALGLGWTVLAALAVLAPALRPGLSLGPFDLLARAGLTQQAGSVVHNGTQSDQIFFFAPMTDLAWHQVRSGHLPLWNPYNVLGTPLAFNWESGVFSLPMLIGYLVPASFAYTVVVLVKLVIAGSGVYVLCRVLGLRPVSAAFGGTVFELSGTVLHYSGWAITGVECWFGWIFAATILLVRGRHRVRDTVFLAVAIAFAIYGGYPAALVLLGLSLALFGVVCLLCRRSGIRSAVRPVLHLAVAGVGGLGLGAALLLPGLQTAGDSARRFASGSSVAYPLSRVTNLLAAGLQGRDFKTGAYVGVITIVLGVVATRMAWNRPEVRALVVLALAGGVLTFLGPVDRLVQALPDGGVIHWDQAVISLTFALAVLGAVGLDQVLRNHSSPLLTKWALGSFAGAGVVLVGVVVGIRLKIASGGAPYQASLIWPGVQVALGLALFGYLTMARRSQRRPRVSGRWLVAALLGVETAFLISVGASFWSLSSGFFSPTPAVTELHRLVGNNLVGLGSCTGLSSTKASPREVGIRADANIGYALRELAVYDPILPESYYRAWTAVSGTTTPPSLSRLGIFCARITTATEARIFGVGDVLEPPWSPPPTGAIFVTNLGGESLFAIPRAAQATISAVAPRGTSLPIDDPGTPVPVTSPDAASWHMVVDAPSPQVLRLRLSAVPGWHATIDGRALTLGTWADGAMLQARIPAGTHVVELQYWPTLFTVGIVLASLSALAIVLVGLMTALFRTRRRVRSNDH